MTTPAPRSDAELRDAIRDLDAEAAGQPFTAEQKERWNELNKALNEHQLRRDRLRDLAGRTANTEGEAQPRRYDARKPVPSHLSAARSDALRAIDLHSSELSDEAARSLEDLIERDVTGPAGGVDARYLAAVGDPDYRGAFGKLLMDPTTGHLQMTAREQTALHAANGAYRERSLAEGTTTTGGFAIPIGIDPTIMLTSNGALNPIREVAQVRQMTTHELRLVTSAGVTASFSAEATEANDDSPTLAQPVLYAEKAQAFVPFSIELSEDWSGLIRSLGDLIADERDVLESTKFLTGAGHGSTEPQGLLVGATAVVTTAGTATLATGDVYALLQSIPPRFQANTTWLSSPTVLDKVYRLTPAGSTTEPQLMSSREDPVLGRRTREWSDMTTAFTSGSSIVAVGDFTRGFVIGDRVGMSVELIPHLFGTANNRPTGQRGIYAHWRTGSIVAVPQAIKVLKML